MLTSPAQFSLRSPEATSQAAARLAPRLVPGDVILLSGSVGAGKTHFARHLIQSVLNAPEDIPSPTFTLVQTYDTSIGQIWHSDLYRISSTFEIEELGLSEAFDTAICLIEWPDRLGELRPASALELAFEDGTDDDARILTATWTAEHWPDRLAEWTTL